MPADFGSRADASERLLVVRAGTVRPLDSVSALWCAQQGSAAHMLTQTEAALLRHAEVFRTPAALVEAAVRETRMPKDVAERALQRLIEADVLAELGSLLPPAGDEAAPPAPLVTIRTCNRPAALGRVLDSIVSHADSASVRGFAVLDDSIDPDGQREARARTESFAAKVGAPVRYFGAVEAAALVQELARDCALDPGAIGELVDPARRGAIGTGARLWNLAVLLGAGGMLSILDDDMMFPLRAPEGTDSRFGLNQYLDNETRYFDDPAECAGLPQVPGDPFALAARYVGCSPGSLLARDGFDRVSARGRTLGSVGHLRPTARIVAAFTGTYGGIPYNSSVYLNTTSEASLDSLMRAPYRHARLEGDDVWQGVFRPRIVPRAVFTPLLMDLRTLRPFSGTFGKQDDSMFLHLMKAIDPSALFVFMPAAIGHYTAEARHRVARSLEPAITDTNNFLVACVNDTLPLLRSEDPEHRLALLGSYFGELARSSERRLSDSLLAWRDGIYAPIVVRVGNVLAARPQAPEEWRRYAEQLVKVNRAALNERTFGPEYLAHIRSALRQAERAALSWPVMWRYCEERNREAMR